MNNSVSGTNKGHIMEKEIDVRKRIVSTAQKLFFQFGFSRVTVDEIALKLGISKKTIYKYFESKNDIVNAVTQETLHEMEGGCQKILRQEDIDFVDKLREMMKQVAVQYSTLGKPLLEDLEKNAPHIWKQIADFRSKRINIDFRDLLREGIKKGMFRNDIDEDLMLMIYVNAIETTINPQTLLHLPFSATQVFEAIMKVFYEGILTEESKSRYLSRQSVLSVAQQRI